MKRFKHMRIRTKMLLGFLLIIVLVMTLVYLSVRQIERVAADYMTVIRHPISLRATLLEFQSEYRNLRRVGATMSIYVGAGRSEKEYEPLLAAAGDAYRMALVCLDRAQVIMSTNPLLTDEQRSYRLDARAELERLFIHYHDTVTEPLIAATRAHDRDTVYTILGPAEESASAIRDQLASMLLTATDTENMHVRRAEDDAEAVIFLLVMISVLTVIFAIGISLYVADYIAKPLAPLTHFMNNVAATGDISFSPEDVRIIERFGRNRDELGQVIVAAAAFVRRVLEIGKGLEQVAAGDLTAEISLLSNRDSMGLAFRRMVDNLNGMCGDISASSVHVATGAGQVTSGAQALSAGATEQAASIEELSVAIAEMAERTKNTAGMAGQAAELAASIKVSAERSSAQMDGMMAAVGEISEASQSIRKIIKTIDEIAFQTNILAVNAAVEAAHAGKYGKGFSVVATEVRNLAAKSATAAKDTERLIANSIEKSELGVQIVGETSVSLSEIVTGINMNNLLVAEIAKSSEDQSVNITQINAGVNQVAQVVQQNSSTAEESAAASEEMYNQSAMLQKLVSQFHLRDDAEGAAAAAALTADAGTFYAPDVLR